MISSDRRGECVHRRGQGARRRNDDGTGYYGQRRRDVARGLGAGVPDRDGEWGA